MTNPRENPVPQVTIRDIEHLAWATRKKVVDEEPVIDGYRWGLGRDIITHGYDYEIERPFAIYINWGYRNSMVLEEVDEQAESLATKREEERRLAELEREAQRHLGEGI